MVDTTGLKEKIDKNGRKLGWLAEQMGIDRRSLWNKITGVTEFKASEIQKLSELLDLNAKQRDSIFFA